MCWCGVYVVIKYVLEGLIDVLCLEMCDIDIKVILIEFGFIILDIWVKVIFYYEWWIDIENFVWCD